MYRLLLKTLLVYVFLSAGSLCAQDAPLANQPLDRGRIQPTVVKLQPGAEQQFKAIIEAPRFNYARLADKVAWTVNDIAGGNAQVGTIDAKGLYRAPATAPAPHEVHIRAEVEGVANRFLFATVLVGEPELAYTMSSSWTDPPAAQRLRYPHSIFFDPKGNLLIADEATSRVFRFSPDGKLLTEIGLGAGGRRMSGEGAPPSGTPSGPPPSNMPYIPTPGLPFIPPPGTPGHFAGPRVAFSDPSGTIYVLDIAERRPMIQVFDTEGHFQYSFGHWGTLPGELLKGHAMAFDSKGLLHVSDVENVRIDTFERTGKFLSSWGLQGARPGDLNAPHGIYIDPNDEIFVLGYYGPTQKFTADGHFLVAFAYADPPDHSLSFQTISGDRWGDVYVPLGRDGLGKFSNTGDFLGWVVKGHAVHWATVAPDGTVYLLPALAPRGQPQPKSTVEVYSEQ
jgi:hypothetical protein